VIEKQLGNETQILAVHPLLETVDLKHRYVDVLLFAAVNLLTGRVSKVALSLHTTRRKSKH
jgi:hypothetical protein